MPIDDDSNSVVNDDASVSSHAVSTNKESDK